MLYIVDYYTDFFYATYTHKIASQGSSVLQVTAPIAELLSVIW